MVSQTEFEAERHLEQLFPANQDDNPFEKLVDKYDGKRITGLREPSYRRVADDRISPTDPSATPMPPSKGGTAILAIETTMLWMGAKQGSS